MAGGGGFRGDSYRKLLLYRPKMRAEFAYLVGVADSWGPQAHVCHIQWKAGD